MALFAMVAQLAEKLAAEASRIKKRAAIAEAIRAAAVPHLAETFGRPHGEALPPSAQDLADAGRFALYLAGQPFPEADPRKLNAGGALLTRALKQISGCIDAALTAAYRRHGDLGAAAYDLLTPPYGHAPATATLTLDDLAATFDAMAAARSTAARFASVEALLRRATALEAKYLLKLMLGDMRIGVKQSLIEEAIAVAASTSADPVAPEQVRHAVMLEADLCRAVSRAFEGTLAQARMTLFHPLGFMLASPVDTPEEAVERFTAKAPKPTPAKRQRKKKAAAAGEETEAEEASEAFPDLITPESATPTDAAEQAFADNIETVSTPAFRRHPEPKAKAPHIEDATQQLATPPLHAFLEDKYDGMRAQLHAGDPAQPGRVVIYSRNREDITESFPELAEAFRNAPSPIILDGEILGWDLATDKALPFAVLSQRIGRKRVDNDLRRQVPVIFMAFDLLFEAGELLLPLPLRERRARLETLAARLKSTTTAPLGQDPSKAAENATQAPLFATEFSAAGPAIQRLKLSPAKLVESAEAIDRAYADARARANEGVMLKAAGSAYLPGRRGLAWVKLKRELATLDVVITGAEFGHGRRAGLLSDYTFAVRAAGGAPAQLLNVGKAYSGVTDAEILELTAWLKTHTLEDHGHFRTVEPLRVLEVAFNNIMRSTRHASGFALRFPRILRIRDDKPVDEIDTIARVEEIYNSQPDRPAEELKTAE